MSSLHCTVEPEKRAFLTTHYGYGQVPVSNHWHRDALPRGSFKMPKKVKAKIKKKKSKPKDQKRQSQLQCQQGIVSIINFYYIQV